MTKMIAMPTMPSVKCNKPSHPCACGCGMATKATWASGHDGRATGWAMRVMRGHMKLDEVPANERAGCEIMMERAARKEAKAS